MRRAAKCFPNSLALPNFKVVVTERGTDAVRAVVDIHEAWWDVPVDREADDGRMRSSLGTMTRVIATLALIAVSVLAVGRAGGSRLAPATSWPARLRRVRSGVLGRMASGDRLDGVATTDGRVVVAAARQRPVRAPRYGDGVVGFVVGLVSVIVLLALAVAFAAQSAH